MKMKALSLASTVLLCAATAVSSSSVEESEGDAGESKCTLYLAQSTIPNAGLGMFTGVPVEEDEYLGYGDPAIPILDMDFHAGGSMQKEGLPLAYAKEMGADMGSEAEVTSGFSSGFGSLPNCHFRLKNIGETPCQHDTAGIGRADVGAGAFTPYHNRSTFSMRALEAGSELFVDYGINWFLTREADMGMVPLQSSYEPATRFMKAAERLLQKISGATDDSGVAISDPSLEDAMIDLWSVVKQSPYKSRPLSAIPSSYSVAKRAFEVGIQQTELEESIRSIKYLDEHGKCVDNIRPGNSTIPHAGRGAFATKFIPNGGYISIAPLLHIPERQTLDMYADKFDPLTGEELGERDMSQPTGHQLLRNYCFGHRSSTLLLCPYAPGVQFINHSNESPNAKIVWSTDSVFHNASWLEEPVSFFDNIWSVNMAFEYVATKDIHEGDEILIDYGVEWQDAWNKHVAQWQPPEGAESYVSAQQLDENPHIPIPTHDEDDTLFDSINIWCLFSRKSVHKDQHTWQEHDENGLEYPVEKILFRTPSDDDGYHYTVELHAGEDSEPFEPYVVVDVPRKALSFYQNSYRSDIHIKGAFRHEMMIPDAIFPDAWKNALDDGQL